MFLLGREREEWKLSGGVSGVFFWITRSKNSWAYFDF
jgi:hypothetical protein